MFFFVFFFFSLVRTKTTHEAHWAFSYVQRAPLKWKNKKGIIEGTEAPASQPILLHTSDSAS